MTTLAQAFTTTLNTRWVGKAREEVETRSIHSAEKFFGTTTNIDKLNQGDIEDYIKHLKISGNSPATINGKLSTISVTLNHHRELGITKNPLVIKKLKHSSNARMRFFSAAMVEKIEQACTNEFRPFFQWSLETGMRPSESRSIHKGDVREMEGIGWLVDIRKTKNGDQRSIPLTKKAKYALNMMGDAYPWGKFTEELIRKEWQVVRRALGLNHEWVFYLCRHTCATRLLSKGVNVKVVQNWMGHKDINMTLKYAKLVPSDLALARNILDTP
jgi:site-specific recombinase XerD